MIPFALVLATVAVAAPAYSDAPSLRPTRFKLLADSTSPHGSDAPGAAGVERLFKYTLEDAPTSGTAAFLSSSLTSFTGLVTLIGMVAGPAPGLPGSDLAWRGRLAASLFLMSAGPSVGDLLNDDKPMFFVATGVRTLMCALSWGAIELSIASGANAPLLVAGSVLLVTLVALVWTGWCGADLVRSIFAPDRWVERKNREQNKRAPPAAMIGLPPR